jgi:hypothetical protein
VIWQEVNRNVFFPVDWILLNGKVVLVKKVKWCEYICMITVKKCGIKATKTRDPIYSGPFNNNMIADYLYLGLAKRLLN